MTLYSGHDLMNTVGIQILDFFNVIMVETSPVSKCSDFLMASKYQILNHLNTGQLGLDFQLMQENCGGNILEQ